MLSSSSSTFCCYIHTSIEFLIFFLLATRHIRLWLFVACATVKHRILSLSSVVCHFSHYSLSCDKFASGVRSSEWRFCANPPNCCCIRLVAFIVRWFVPRWLLHLTAVVRVLLFRWWLHFCHISWIIHVLLCVHFPPLPASFILCYS